MAKLPLDTQYTQQYNKYQLCSQDYRMLRLLVSIIIAAATVRAQADEWIVYARDTQDYSYNHTRITHHAAQGITFVVWTRHGAQTKRQELHCASSSWRTVYETRDARGETEFVSRTPTAEWQWARPDGVEMALIDWICQHYH